MAQPNLPVAASDDLPAWVDQMADQFEEAWRSGTPPRIGEFLAGESGERREQLAQELIKVDLERRWRSGDRRPLSAYLEELSSLINSESAVWSNLERYYKELQGGATGPSDPPPTIPGTIGKYRVIERIGGGGQATVYRAVHPALGRDVAIKWGRRSTDSADRDELLAEGRLLAEIDHPHLVRVYDFDFHEGRPFLVMDYVRGRTLKQYAEQHRLAPRRSAEIMATVARAVGAVHRCGVTHQDLKPQNILITEVGVPRVLDFGLARLRDVWADEAEQPAGGTVAYMAPEQARCEFDRVGPRTDVFALGAVLYSLLVGRAPYYQTDAAERLERARNCDFHRTALRNIHVPRRLEAICLRAMSEKPEERYESAESLAVDLERFRSQSRLIVGSAVLLVAALLLSLLLWGLGVLGRDQSRATQTESIPGVATIPSSGSTHVIAEPPNVDLNVAVQKGELYLPIENGGSVATGDVIRISVHAPPAYHLSLFAVSGSGKLEDLGAVTAEAAVGYKLQPHGTALVFVCGSRTSPVRLANVTSAWDERGDWPHLPRSAVLRFGSERVWWVEKGRPSERVLLPDGRDPSELVVKRIEGLRQRLKEQFELVAGLVFYQADKPATDK